MFLERYNISPVMFVIVAAIIIFLGYQLIGSLVTFLLFGFNISSANVNGIRIVTGISQIILILVPTIILTKFISNNIWKFLRYQKPSLLQITLAFVGIFSLQQLLQLYLVIQDLIPFPEPIRQFLNQMKQLLEETYRTLAGSQNLSELIFVTLIIALIPAFAEETLFRGMVQKVLENSMKPQAAIIITGVIFGIFHLNPLTFIPLSVIGIYLGFLTYKSENILIAISAHFFNNFFAVLAIYFNYGDDEVVTGKITGMPNELFILTFFTFLVVFIVSIYYFIRVTNIINKVSIKEV